MIIKKFIVLAIFIIKATTAQIEDSLLSTTDKCLCGKPSLLVDRVVGGKEVKPYSYPWMAVLLRGRVLHCGGTLINDRYVLTAAHCIEREYQSSLRVYLGIHNIAEAIQGKVQRQNIASFRMHEKYWPIKLSPDIGLIKLKKPVKFTNKISPICLPKTEKDYLRQSATVVGWGRLRENGVSSRKLMHANVTVISNQECTKKLRKGINNWMICGHGGNRDACDGDSGGPLQIQSRSGKTRFWEEIGIVSWGIGCARPNNPGVYARVPKLLKWIAKNTKDAIYCKSTG